MTEVIMLCFRDLVTRPGETVEKHRALIRQHGYCWWGWWKKPIEEVPAELLARMLGTGATPAPIQILLFDCGQHKLHLADLAAVAIAPNTTGMSSPEIGKTPDYYVHVRCAAWFKLASLQDVPDAEKELRRIKYLSFPSWPKPDRHDGHKGQPIESFDELDEMKVTLWHLDWTKESHLGEGAVRE